MKWTIYDARSPASAVTYCGRGDVTSDAIREAEEGVLGSWAASWACREKRVCFLRRVKGARANSRARPRGSNVHMMRVATSMCSPLAKRPAHRRRRRCIGSSCQSCGPTRRNGAPAKPLAAHSCRARAGRGKSFGHSHLGSGPGCATRETRRPWALGRRHTYGPSCPVPSVSKSSYTARHAREIE